MPTLGFHWLQIESVYPSAFIPENGENWMKLHSTRNLSFSKRPYLTPSLDIYLELILVNEWVEG